MICPICHRRRPARDDTLCRTCRRFVAEFIDSGLIRPQRVPMVADVMIVMRHLGVSQDRAVMALGGTP